MKLWARRGFEWAEDGLVGLWCPVLTGGTGSTLLDCNPSTSNHGTLTNYSNINTAWIGSQYGTVLDFNGASNRVVNTLSSNYTFGNRDFSFGGWFWLSATTGSYAPLITTWGNASNQFSGRWFLGLFDGRVRVFDSLGNIAITYIPTAGVWNYYLVTKRAGVVTLFVDAMAQGTYSGVNQNWSNDGAVSIGGTSDGFAICRCAEAIVSRSGFTDTQISELHRIGPGGAWQLTPPIRRYATILANAYTLIAASAGYSITGQPVGLLAGRLLAADAASYLLAGNAAGLNAGRLLTADSAAYALTGQDANLLAGRLLTGDTATYNLIGNSANLLASRTLQANSAQYTVTGSDAALLAGRLLDCGSSAFLLSPNQAGLLASRKLTADQASILLTTQATNLYAGRKITAETAQFILIASPVDLTFGGGGAAPYYYLFLLGGSR